MDPLLEDLEKDLEEIKKFVQMMPKIVQVPQNVVARRESQSIVSVDSSAIETMLRFCGYDPETLKQMVQLCNRVIRNETNKRAVVEVGGKMVTI